MKKKTIVIYGVPGVGKTTLGKRLFKKIDQSMLVDADDLWRINPFTVNDNNKRMVEENIKSVYNNFKENPELETFIFLWVIPNINVYNLVNNWFDDATFIQLQVDSATYKIRLDKDNRDSFDFEKYIELFKNYKDIPGIQIDTSNKDIDRLINEIKNLI
ncbi:AAA family ATPase [Candidatus Izemoplasma sp. B36]|uniref:AAA family ATPase n=1 Tax=Candidatus Izemoplasma sp. B36 TaxID=3242468 RepID=UPI0035584BE7